MANIFFRDIGSHPPRDLEVKLFDDGELEFYTSDCHININKKSVAELVAWLIAAEQGVQADECPNCRGAGIVPTGMGATVTCIHCFGSGIRR